MTNDVPEERIEGKNFTAPFKAILVLHQQPAYNLSSSDFAKLKHPPNTISTALAAGAFTLSLTFGLPELVAFIRKETVSSSDVVISIVAFVVGLVVLEIGSKLTGPRREVMKSIEEFFVENEGVFIPKGDDDDA